MEEDEYKKGNWTNHK